MTDHEKSILDLTAFGDATTLIDEFARFATFDETVVATPCQPMSSVRIIASGRAVLQVVTDRVDGLPIINLACLAHVSDAMKMAADYTRAYRHAMAEHAEEHGHAHETHSPLDGLVAPDTLPDDWTV